MAQMFMPEAALADGYPRVLRALRPGAWLVTAATCAPGLELPAALSRLRTSTWGGGRRFAADVTATLAQAGFVGARALPAPPGAAMTPVLARRP